MADERKYDMDDFNERDESAEIEALAYSDYLCSPYYRTFYETASKSSIIQKRGLYDNTLTPRRRPATAPVRIYRRRKGLAIICAILMVVILAVAALGYIGTIVPEYVSAFVSKDGEELEHIGLTDPVVGGIVKFVDIDLDSVFYTQCLQGMDSNTDIIDTIAFYALPIAIALALVFAFVLLIMMLITAAKKSIQRGYVLKKTGGIVIISLILFVLSLIAAVASVIWNGEGFGEIMNFFTQSTTKVYAGYGMYAFVGLSLLNLIFSLFVQKKSI